MTCLWPVAMFAPTGCGRPPKWCEPVARPDGGHPRRSRGSAIPDAISVGRLDGGHPRRSRGSAIPDSTSVGRLHGSPPWPGRRRFGPPSADLDLDIACVSLDLTDRLGDLVHSSGPAQEQRLREPDRFLAQPVVHRQFVLFAPTLQPGR